MTFNKKNQKGLTMPNSNTKKPTTNGTQINISYGDKLRNNFIEAMEAGVAPWQKQWEAKLLLNAFPINGATGKNYSGVNAINLMLEATLNNYSDPRWLTEKQATALGGTLKDEAIANNAGVLAQYLKYSEYKPVMNENNEQIVINGQKQWEEIKLQHPKLQFTTLFNASLFNNLDVYAERDLNNTNVEYEQPVLVGGNIQTSLQKEFINELANFMQSGKNGKDFIPEFTNNNEIINKVIEIIKSDKSEIYKLANSTEKLLNEFKNFQVKNKETDQTLQDKTPKLAAKRTYLYVPYKESVTAKDIGVKFDPFAKANYVDKGFDLSQVEQWLPINQSLYNINSSTSAGENYIESFKQELEKRGFDVSNGIIEDGHFHRCHLHGDKMGSLNGSYIIHNNGTPMMNVENFKTGVKERIFSGEQFSAGATEFQIKHQEQVNRVILVQNQKDLETKHFATSQRLNKEFGVLTAAPLNHPYLIAKSIEPHGAKIDEKNNLVIPFYSANDLKTIKTIQTISMDENSNFQKQWEKGGQKSGNFAIIADTNFDIKKPNQTIIICEGFATGASLKEATNIPVLIAGDAGNIKSVLENVIKENNNIQIIVAADNDLNQVGINKADEAIASLKSGYSQAQAPIVVSCKPSFTAKEKQAGLTDFNDLGVSRGKAAVATQISQAENKLIKIVNANEAKEIKEEQKEHKEKSQEKQMEMSR